jgi:mannose-6-phosphate isomerase-like protein (cupin superfamily)
VRAVTGAELAKLTPEEKEAYHREQESKVEKFAYHMPHSDEPKDFFQLGKSRLCAMIVQVVREGGENNLHYHNNSDTTWFVLRGGAKFYGPGDVLIADLGAEEGIVIPGGARYWFEKTGTEALELLQFVARDVAAGKSERINLEQHKSWMTEPRLQVYENNAALARLDEK